MGRFFVLLPRFKFFFFLTIPCRTPSPTTTPYHLLSSPLCTSVAVASFQGQVQ